MKFKPSTLQNIAAQLKQNKVGLFPFDTIWGLTSTINPEGIARINQLKNRHQPQPLIILLPDMTWLPKICAPLSETSLSMIKENLPGPITFIVQKASTVPDIVTAGKSTVGFRIPDYFPVNHLLYEVGQPLVSTSANHHGQGHSSQLSDIPNEIRDNVDFIFDCVSPLLDQQSSIIDLSHAAPQIIRKGTTNSLSS